ncbi:probable disease resistance protein At1g61300 isoform X2 [Zingiber officinale]|uniref:probable disease resistance protein At1g61300 isoform X2 n=1 Tax=Zingiber officinale TaxID=94328 RepID=UPI001C4C0D06|nr:probable disease resistance protein At1g61300 isoform X2 [Zingiber officinale]
MACIKLNLNVDVNKGLSGLKATLRLGRPKSGTEKLEKEMTRLRCKRDDIKNQINEAEREGKIPTNEVSQWLREVEILEGKVADIDQDFQSMIHCCVSLGCFSCNCFNRTGGSSSNPTEAFAANIQEVEENAATDQTQQAGDDVPIRESSNCCSIIRRAAKKLDEANELMSRAGALDPIATVGPPEPTLMLPISHRSPVGIESYVEDIVGYVDGGEGNIIGIYGMGGIGKTTMLKRIQQHYLLKHTIFDRVIWVVASKDCQLKRLQMNIAKSLGLQTLQENDDEQTCGDKLFSFLKNRNCLLLLDDIWEHVDLQLLGMAHSAIEQGQQQQPRKVVVFTTRSEIVCAQMKAEKKTKVKCLDSDQAWKLFEQNSDGDVLSSDAGIKFVAEELTKECAGLPLALVTVARAMSGKRSWEAWNDALHQIRDKHEWTTIALPEDSLVMYKAFKLSYDSLENDSVRECLLCCALWPEDYEIFKFSKLIPCWIGCGIIHEFNVINEAFAKGYSHLEALGAASLLEKCDSDYVVKMHDVIRDMALLMVSGLKGNKRKWIVKAGIGLSDLPRQEEWQEAERASFMINEITCLQEYGASTFPKLSMLILHGNQNLKTIPPSLFASLPRLTYLDLSDCCITELPKEICSLTELQYLNLSDNHIIRLPIEFGCLSKLEYLFLRYTGLETVPNGTIANLLMLQWLDIRGIPLASDWWWDELKCYKGRHQLSVGIHINATTDNIERLNMLPLNVSIWELILDGEHISKLPSYDLGTPQWGCRVSDKLEFLYVTRVRLDRLVLAAGVGRESSLGCLKRLDFHFLTLLEVISLNRVRLNNLRELIIFGCLMLKDVSWVLQLPCLNFLQIRYCREMKELISESGNSNSITISSIQTLVLDNMSNLNRIANRPLHFPYLEYIDVKDCPELKKLSFGVEMLKNRIKRIRGEDDWWNNLDWDDVSIKDSLTPCFRPPISE